MEMKTEQVANALDVSFNTIVNYTKREDYPLKVTETKRGFKTYRVYESEDVKEFAKFHGMPCDLQ